MRWVKIIASVFGVLLLVAILGFVALVTFVSPNRFKPLIAEQVKKVTGRELNIDGDLSWTIFPSLGVKVGHLELSNPSDFKQKTFVEIQSATVNIHVLPLLHGKIKSSGLTVKGLKLYLIKNANGETNWDFQQDANPSKPAQGDSSSSSTAMTKPLGLAIGGINISNANIYWIDEKSKQNFNIDKFELHAKNISLIDPFEVKTSFQLEGKNPNVSGKVNMTSKISLDIEKQIFYLQDLNCAMKLNQDKKKFDIRINGDVAADLTKQKLRVDNLAGDISNLKLAGKVNVVNLLTNPKTTGHLQIQPIDIKNWLQATGQDVDSLQTMKNLSGDFDFSAGTTFQSVKVDGSVKLDELKASKVTVSNITMQTQMTNGVLQFAPITAEFYQGSIQGQTKINLNNAVPRISVQAKLNNMQAAPLLADVAGQSKLKFSGAGNVDLQITTSGTSGDEIVKNLNGTSKLNFNNGTLKGIDVGYLLDNAYSLSRRQGLTGSNTNETQFGTLTANAVIRNGVISNTDLHLDSPRFDTKGNGTIDLVNQKINYQLQTVAKQNPDQKNNVMNLYGYAIPIGITGSLSDPSIKLDTTVLMKAIAKQQLEKAKEQVQQKIQTKIEDKVKQQISDKAGDLLNNLLGH